ncbi:MAG: DUF3152 domain-containing protein [Acidobacteriota bacterium]
MVRTRLAKRTSGPGEAARRARAFAQPSAILALAVLIGLSAACGGRGFPKLVRRYSGSGRLLRMNLVSAPFPHPQRQNGYSHEGDHYPRRGHYDDDSVAVFVPNGYRPGERVDLVFYFHGWDRDLAGVLRSYQVIEQFARSGKNAILVLPQGPKRARDSFGGKLEDADGFRNLVGDVLAELRRTGAIMTETPGDLILAGHSGGYHAIASILARGGLSENVKEVFLFDALYGEIPAFTDWQARQQGKIIDIYTEDGGTREESRGLMEEFDRGRVPYLAAMDAEVTHQDLRDHRLIFLFSRSGHDEVVYETDGFARFLSASVLDDLPGRATAPPAEVRVAYWAEVRSADPALADFPGAVHDILTDPRGWARAGFAFERDPEATYRVIIAEGGEADRLCAPYNTRSLYSCQNGPLVVINADRWRRATPEWTGDLPAYRIMVINHEVGHLLHMHHPLPQCPGPGLPAPIMAQQSTELGECRPNPWPLEWEIELAARRLEPLAPGYDHDPAGHRPKPPLAVR